MAQYVIAIWSALAIFKPFSSQWDTSNLIVVSLNAGKLLVDSCLIGNWEESVVDEALNV